MDELDRDAGDDRRLTVARAGQVHEQRAEPLAAGGERLAPHLGDDPLVSPDGRLEPVLELDEVGVEARRLSQLCERAQRASAVCSATMPPANVRKRTESNPAAAINVASSSGPGKRRTLAGR